MEIAPQYVELARARMTAVPKWVFPRTQRNNEIHERGRVRLFRLFTCFVFQKTAAQAPPSGSDSANSYAFNVS